MGFRLLLNLFFFVFAGGCFAGIPEGTFVIVGPPPNTSTVPGMAFKYQIHQAVNIMSGMSDFTHVADFTYAGTLRDMLVFQNDSRYVVFGHSPSGDLVRLQIGNGNIQEDILPGGANFRWFSPTEIVTLSADKRQLLVWGVDINQKKPEALSPEKFFPKELSSFHIGRGDGGVLTVFASNGAKHDAFQIELNGSGRARMMHHWDIDPHSTPLSNLSQTTVVIRPNNSVFLMRLDMSFSPSSRNLFQLNLDRRPMDLIGHQRVADPQWKLGGWDNGILLRRNDHHLWHYDPDNAKLAEVTQDAFAVTRLGGNPWAAQHVHMVQFPHRENSWQLESRELDSGADFIIVDQGAPKGAAPDINGLYEEFRRVFGQVALDAEITSRDLATLDRISPIDQKGLAAILGRFGLEYSAKWQTIQVTTSKTFTVREWLEAVANAAPCKNSALSIATN